VCSQSVDVSVPRRTAACGGLSEAFPGCDLYNDRDSNEIMFEKFTERARRVLFFARYEASHFGSMSIETEHLLLAVLREDANLPIRLIGQGAKTDAIAENARAWLTVGEKRPTSIDLSLSVECRNILGYAVNEAELLHHRYVGVEHVVLGIMREGKCNAAEILRKHGLQLSVARAKLAETPSETQSAVSRQSPLPGKKELLNHFLATLAYRVQKALRGAPEAFPNFRAAAQVRTPHELICHMTGVLGYSRTFFVGGRFPPPVPGDFESDVRRFHEMLESIKVELEKPGAFLNVTPEQLLQGPLSDAMTHAGQLAMLRRLAGSPVAPENFIKASIDAANLRPDQPDPLSPDVEWPERPTS